MKYLKAKILLLCFQSLFVSIAFAEEFEIKHADSLEAEKEKINIKGSVVINYKDSVIEAPECIIESNSKGEPEKAIFTGRAKLKLKDRILEGDKITVSIKDKVIIAEGNTLSKLKDKKNNDIEISADFQELHWSGEDANAKGNLKTIYQDTEVNSDEAKIIYKNKRPEQAVFLGKLKQANLEQPTSITFANEFTFDIDSKNIQGRGDVKSTIWPNQKLPREKQDPVHLNSEDLYIDQGSGIITAKSGIEKVNVDYQDTKGESREAYLIRDNKDGKPEKILFIGNANVSQIDKQITSEEVVFNFKDKKLTSNTKTNIRPKTIIFKK
ncbi:MAG: hypothetical protein A3B68_04165 [Candidatus Melainabacteria bacterium RIFCSPHIGHO2_02_FULL_34_12]|nr:MAG: hypothetical protein A3B68_04165 [Candidatus Melainabacteria bacterium RIFCSPHIGHO2_02_FULL_34_12]